VGDWIGYWVYNQIQPFAFPVKRYSDRTQVLVVYHQYGFPQDMDRIVPFAKDKGLVLVEDCAHALKSSYHGKPTGSFGEFSIYSFSKFVFCLALGAVASSNSDFLNFVDAELQTASIVQTWIKDIAKLLYEMTIDGEGAIAHAGRSFLNMSYAQYGVALRPSSRAVALATAKVALEVRTREDRYGYFRQRVDHLGVCDHLESSGVAPYVIPIRIREAARARIVEQLRARQVSTGVYQFDLNRNLLDPKYEPTVWVPCHGGFSDTRFDEITETVVASLS